MRNARVSGRHVSQESGNWWSVGWSVGREAKEETKGQRNWPQAGTQRFKGKPVKDRIGHSWLDPRVREEDPYLIQSCTGTSRTLQFDR
jgi:hypothetical protein